MHDTSVTNDADTWVFPYPSPPGSGSRESHDAWAMLDLIPNAVVCLDSSLRVTYMNAAAHQLGHLADDCLCGRSDDLPEVAGSSVLELCHRVLATGINGQIELLHRDPDKWLSIHVSRSACGLLVHCQEIPTQKPAELVGERTSRRLAQVPGATTEAVIALDADWKILFSTKHALLHVQGKRELTGSNLWEVLPALRGSAFERLCRKTMRERVSQTFEAQLPGLKERWIAVQCRPSEEGMIVSFSEITDHQAAVEIPMQQHSSFESMTGSAQFASFEINLATGEVAFGRGSSSVHGHGIEELVDVAAIETFTHLEHSGQQWNGSDQATGSCRPFASEYRITGAMGEIRWIEARGMVVFQDGLRTHIRGIAIDITQRKETEQARQLATRRLEQVLDSTSDGVFSVNESWNITFLNRQARLLLGRGDDAIGKNLWEQFPDAVGGPSYDHYHRTMRERVPIAFESASTAIEGKWLSIESRPSEDGIVVFFADITERRRAEQAILEQQSLLATVQENGRLATWEHDLVTQRITFGPGSCPIYGVPLESISDTASFVAILHPDHRDQIEKDLEQAVELKETFVSDFRTIGADGEVNWLETRGRATFKDGVATHLRGITIDIRERKRNEQALAASEQRYRVLADLNPQALWAGAPDGSITYANQFYLDYIGKTLDDLPDWLECFAPEDRARVLSSWTASVGTGVAYDIEARQIRGADGASRWWHIRAAPVRDSVGVITSWLGVSEDIHEVKTAAKILRLKQEETEQQRAELETVYRTTPVALALFDPLEFRFLRVNERGAEIMGLPERELVGRRLTDLPHVPNILDMFRQVSQGESFRDLILEGEMPARPGDRRVWNVNYFPVYGPSGTVDAIATASLDITNQKRSEAALIQSEKLAAVGRLASSISHEINNPLEAVTNLLYLIATSPDMPADVASYVQTAQAELSRVSQIATQTLRFHRQSVSRTHISAAELVEAVLSLYGGRLANSGIEVKARYDTTRTLLCFENDIRQVLNNLIANAIDAMRTGGDLMVRAHETSGVSGDAGIRITIADTGHGMTDDVRRRIFEPFYTTKNLNGTGLGLWISAGIVDRHHGKLRVRSRTGLGSHGTVFCLFLPFTLPDAD